MVAYMGIYRGGGETRGRLKVGDEATLWRPKLIWNYLSRFSLKILILADRRMRPSESASALIFSDSQPFSLPTQTFCSGAHADLYCHLPDGALSE